MQQQSSLPTVLSTSTAIVASELSTDVKDETTAAEAIYCHALLESQTTVKAPQASVISESVRRMGAATLVALNSTANPVFEAASKQRFLATLKAVTEHSPQELETILEPFVIRFLNKHARKFKYAEFQEYEQEPEEEPKNSNQLGVAADDLERQRQRIRLQSRSTNETTPRDCRRKSSPENMAPEPESDAHMVDLPSESVSDAVVQHASLPVAGLVHDQDARSADIATRVCSMMLKNIERRHINATAREPNDRLMPYFIRGESQDLELIGTALPEHFPCTVGYLQRLTKNGINALQVFYKSDFGITKHDSLQSQRQKLLAWLKVFHE
jgi:hypothetical protein